MIQPLFIFSDWALLILRLVVGIIFVFHGWPKINNLKETANSFQMMGFKPGQFWGTLVAVLEFVGGLFLISGFLVQLIGLLLALEMVTAILKIKKNAGLVNGYEFDLVLLAASLALATLGGGIYSLDNFFGLILY